MKDKKLKIKERGQSLIECVLFFPIIALLIVMISWWSDIYLSKCQITAGARYGTDLIANCPDFTASDVETEVENMITATGGYEGRRLRKDDLRMKVDINRFPKITATNAINPTLITNKDTCSVGIWYDIQLCPWLKHIIGKDKITVSARSEVLAGTGI